MFAFINKISDIPYNPTAYGAFHILFLMLTVFGVALVFKFTHPNINKKTKLTILITILVVMFLGELYKEYDYYRHGLTGIAVVNEFPWCTFPWQFCDTPVYILFLTLIIPSERFKKIGYTYLLCFGFIVGFAVMVSPSSAFTDRLFVSMQTMIHHGLMIVLSMFILRTKIYGTFKDYKWASLILLSFIWVAFVLNIALHELSGGVIECFYINPKIPTRFPVLDKIQQFSYVLFFITYTSLFLGLGVFFYFLFTKWAPIIISRFKRFIKKERTMGKISLFVFVNYIVISTISYYIIFSKLFFLNLEFYELPFTLLFSGFIGNLVVKVIVGLLVFLIFKNNKKRYITLVVFMSASSIFMFIQVIYAKYYNTLFHYAQFSLVKNPAGDLNKTLAVTFIADIFLYMQFFIFLPPLIYYFSTKWVLKESVTILDSINPTLNLYLSWNRALVGVLSIIMLIPIGFACYSAHLDVEHINTHYEDSLYGVQSSGMYNYYFWKLTNSGKEKNVSSDKEVKEAILKFSKNKEAYTNIFGEVVNREFNTNDIKNVKLAPELRDKSVLGLFKNKNLITIQLETVPMFLIDIAFNHPEFKEQNLLPNLRKLLKESYQFNEFYENTGVAHTCDGEFVAMTGLIPRGYDTIYWEYDKMPYQWDMSLPVIFKNNNYQNISVNGDVPEFYNIYNINKNVYKVHRDYFYDAKNHLDDGYNSFVYLKGKYDFEGNPLILKKDKIEGLYDYNLPTLLKYVINDLKEPYFIRTHTLHPHAPFPDIGLRTDFPSRFKLSIEGAGIFDYLHYIDEYFGEFLKLSKNIKNTVFLFYGDHGSTGYYKNDLETLYGKKLTDAEYKRHLHRVLSFMYVPDDDKMNETGVKSGMIVGNQTLLRSQLDINRTIIELFGLETDYHYFGVNLLSNEKTFAIHPKNNLTIHFDEFIMMPELYNKDDLVFWVNGIKEEYDTEKLYKDISGFKFLIDRNIIDVSKYHFLRKS